MESRLEKAATTTIESAPVRLLRRFLDLALAGFALSLGFHLVPAELFLAGIAAAVLALHLAGVQLLRRTVVEVPLALYALASLLGVLGASGAGASLSAPEALGGFRLAASILLVGAIGTAARAFRLARLLVLAVALQGLFGVVQHLTGSDPLGVGLQAAGADRWIPTGTFALPDALAFAATCSLALLAAAAVTGALRGGGRVAALLLTVPTCLAALLSLANAAVAGLGAGLAAMAVLGRRLRAPLALAAALSAAWWAANALGQVPPGGRLWSAAAAEPTLQLLSDHPMTGVGAGTLGAQAPAFPGSQLASIWATSGPLALIAFVWLVVAVLGRLRRGIKRVGGDPRASALVLGAAAVVTVSLAFGLFFEPLREGANAYLLAFCMALGLAAIPAEPEDEAELEEPVDAPPAPRGSAAVASLSFSLAVIGGLEGLEGASAGEAALAAVLLVLLALGFLPLVPRALAAQLRSLATLSGAVLLVARAFSVVVAPGSQAWWSTPSALASVAALTAGLAGAAWAMRRPGEVGPAAVAGALAAFWIVCWVGAAEFLLPGAAEPGRPFSFNFALGACGGAMLFLAWAGPLGFGEGRLLGIAERLRRLPALSVALGLAALVVTGL